MGQILSVKEAAAVLGISANTLKRRLASGDPEQYIPHWKDGPRGDYKFDEDDVRTWKETRKQRTQPLQPVSS